MLRGLLVALLCCAMVWISVSDAEARRRGRMPIFVGGGGDTIVEVLDLPDIPALQRDDGRYIDLGYLHKRGGGGEWIGHVGSSTQYISLDKAKLRRLLRIAGVSRLPPVPVRSSFSGGWSLWGVLVVVALAAVALKVLQVLVALAKGARTASRRAARITSASSGSRSGASGWDGVQVKIDAAAQSHNQARQQSRQTRGSSGFTGEPALAGRGITRSPGFTGSGGFGRRGR